MNQTPQSILKKYWGFDSFRPLQEDIINSVLQNNDTLALLPTGGGKSVCFQVPALLNPGICIVVSPLIALMKDQVENLMAKGVKAVAIFSGMSRDEVDIALDNCIYGNIKFLYLSPERLLSEAVRLRIEKMNVNLFAVDEAHCISQWGYDFRPPYLQIAEIRSIHPKVPVLALTATATPEVREDIMTQLEFTTRVVYQQSFERKNLSYLVYHLEDKQKKMVDILSKVKGTGIVYVRNRKRTKEYAQFLVENRISADYYHAGLTSQLRSAKQDDWKSGKIRVMVCTNAFGMGIDKPNVRSVIHMDLPDNLESYYQEAGRAGRDEKPAYAIVLYNKTDILDLKKRQVNAFPSIKNIRLVYQAIANYLQVPIDSGMGISYDFEISRFITNYNFDPMMAINCMRVLENEGLICVTDAVYIPSRIHFRVNKIDLYNFQVAFPKYDLFIKTILRSAEGVFDEFVRISEPELADRLKMTYDEITSMLDFLHKNGTIFYVPRKDFPQLTFLIPREDAKYISLDEKKYLDRKNRYIEKSTAVINYVQSNHQCRSMVLLSYFGETVDARCNVCDYCREMNKLELNTVEFENFKEYVLQLVELGPTTVADVIDKAGFIKSEKALEVISWMVDQQILDYNEDGNLVTYSIKNN